MTEQWIQWVPINNLVSKYYIDSVIDDIKNFRIIFSELNNKNNRLQVVFKNSVGIYRNTNESYRLKIMDDLNKKYGKKFYGDWTFFKIENSEYIKWLMSQSYDTIDESSIHFVFVAADSILDVVTTYEPEFKFINEINSEFKLETTK